MNPLLNKVIDDISEMNKTNPLPTKTFTSNISGKERKYKIARKKKLKRIKKSKKQNRK